MADRPDPTASSPGLAAGGDEERRQRFVHDWLNRGRGLIPRMNLHVEQAGPEGVRVRMPFDPEFCLDAAATLLHGGVLTALLDSVFGLANFLAIPGLQSMATLDLRVDYLRPAQSRADILVQARCYHETRHVAFDTGRVWFDGSSDAEVARGTASFALVRGERDALGRALAEEARP